jgi:hypothetical protein
MGAGVAVRIISTVLGAVVPLIAISGFISPTGSSQFGSFSSFIPFQSIVSDNAALSPYAQYLPFLAGGGGALGVWYIVSQAAGGIGSSVAAGSMGRMGGSKMMGMSSMDDIQKRMKAAMDSANLGTIPEKAASRHQQSAVQGPYIVLSGFP